jgi:hypothetical protein
VLGLASLYLLSILVVGSDARASEARLDWFAPVPLQEIRGSLPLVEVTGRVASAPRAPLDLVLALDVSESVFLPAASDVDADGTLGRPSVRRTRRPDGSLRPVRTWTTDPGDTVFEAERASARALLESLRSDSVRVGLLTFAERPRSRARLGAAGPALAALAALRPPAEPGPTDLSRAIYAGERLLRARSSGDRRRVLVLLSDGHATRPGPPRLAGAAARRAARHAARHGIEIHPVAIGPDAAGATSAYADLARPGRGSFLAARDVTRLSAAVLGGAALPHSVVQITNETTGQRARALRVHGDGSFDAFVRLEPGHNRISVEVYAPGGGHLRRVRSVHFASPGERTISDLALTRRLRLRALQIELARPAAGGGFLRRRLEIDPEPRASAHRGARASERALAQRQADAGKRSTPKP